MNEYMLDLRECDDSAIPDSFGMLRMIHCCDGEHQYGYEVVERSIPIDKLASIRTWSAEKMGLRPDQVSQSLPIGFNRSQLPEGAKLSLLTEGSMIDKLEMIAREIVKLCVGNADEPETEKIAAILRREF